MTENKYIAVAYELHTIEDGKKSFVEKATKENPFAFVSGFGFAIDEFEKQIVGLAVGDEFDFTVEPDKAYGERSEDNVIDLDREIFTIDGEFDSKNIFLDAIIPLQAEAGNVFMARVEKITDEKVTVDLNHPLAGKTLHFKGFVVENRVATNTEIEQLLTSMSEGGCCEGCQQDGEGCGSGCGKGCGKA